jgi:hypothetical protein
MPKSNQRYIKVYGNDIRNYLQVKRFHCVTREDKMAQFRLCVYCYGIGVLRRFNTSYFLYIFNESAIHT